jgi:hypothetical protein
VIEMKRVRHAVLAVAGILLANCVAASASGWMSARANPKHPWLYVAGYNNNVVSIYDLAELGTPQIGKVTQGVSGPAGITVDPSGTLYVVDQNANAVTIYPPRATAPTLTLSEGLDFPNSAAVAANGDVYVTSRSNAPAQIIVFPKGQTTPSQYITGPLIQDPLQDFFDAADDLYFTDYSTGVNVLPAGSQQVVSLGLQEAPTPAGIVLDPHNGNLVVQNYAPNAYKTLVYAPGNVNPVRVVNNGLGANLLALGTVRHAQYLFVPNFFGSTVSIYRRDAMRLQSVLDTDAENVNGVAFKPAGVP